ncbi:terminase small subunit [Lentilactobacillus sp. TOM.63]|uniref:terminase small subunit n=1 Tax=Lentilactobacillus sp. TOM.63 TaxID=3055077 RepID=UPI0025A17476|nr:terminase small subunit [Lentilactobacillus sp. TOM.63]MDM7515523.1 terminase small subunit [Lentilactobacillus sp. TOM.63]
MTPRQKKFAREYIKTHNAYQAALNAGYAKATAHNAKRELLDNAGIQNYLAKKTQKAETTAEVTTDQVIVNILNIATGKLITRRTQEYDYLEHKTLKDRSYTGAPSYKDQVGAAQLVLQMAGKLKADDGNLIDAKVRKAKAEAEIAEAKLADLEDDKDDQMDALTDMLGKLAKNVPKDDQNDD